MAGRKNFIKKLKKHDGTWCSDQVEMRDMAVKYFYRTVPTRSAG